ncbi:MAG TPA: S8 family serine peptidase [Duganella sp.]|nr:S8 family serine peptidase [Duganella sp.]
MIDPALKIAIDNATEVIGGKAADSARFLLYPHRRDELAGASVAIRNALAPLGAEVDELADADIAVLAVTLPDRMMVDGPAPFEAAYLMAKQWELRAAEPELYTNLSPERQDGAETDQDLAEEGLLDWCFVPKDPELDNMPRWALDMMKVPGAWAYSARMGRPSHGQGIRIAQPDTGVTDHPELRDIPRFGEIDLIAHASIARDPLDYLGNTAHGTGTASVMVSRGQGAVTGSAPAAEHMPIRAIQVVARVSQLRVAKAIDHAIGHGAHVITMSLGGLPSLFLAAAVGRAIANDIIVLAAAGNCVKMVVWPARYDECIAVAAVNRHRRRWNGSCSGGAVAVSAPGENVLKAAVSVEPDGVAYSIEQGQGTSFAVALTAGVAALWLAHHGRETIIDHARANGVTVQSVFKRLLMETAEAHVEGWDSAGMGTGVVDAEALLKASLDQGVGLEAPDQPAPQAEAQSVRDMLNEAGADGATLADATLVLYGPELANIALEARRCCVPGMDGDESPDLPPVSEALTAALPRDVLDKLRRPLP